MRNSISVLVMGLGLCAVNLLGQLAHADFSMVTCHSLQGSEHQLELVVFNSDIRQLRISTPGSRPHALPINRLLTQNIPGYTVYSVVGLVGQLLEVENKILSLEPGGRLRFSGEPFACD